MNVLINRLLPRVGRDLTYNAAGGSRTDFVAGFLTAALPVLVATGSRPDLAPLVSGQDVLARGRVRQDHPPAPSAATATSFPGYYRGVASWLATPVIYGRLSQPVTPVPSPAVAPSPAPATAAHVRGSRISAPLRFRVAGACCASPW